MRHPTTTRRPGTHRSRRRTSAPRTARAPAKAKATSVTSRTWLGTDAQVVRHVRVYGDGHLATATRIELERQGIHRDTDNLLPSLRPALVIACADSEADQCLNDAAQQALNEGSPLLLCCLAGPAVRLGPLIDPTACFASAAWIQPAPNTPSPASHSPNSRSHSPSPASRSPDARPSTPPASASPASASPASASPASASPASASPSPTPRSPPFAGQPSHLPQPAPRPLGTSADVDHPLHPAARLGALLVSAQALNFLLGARNQCVLDRVFELNPWSMQSKGYRVFHN
jgi:hypothetical protein